MKFTDIFVRRPVLAIVVNLIIIIGGLQAINSLTVRQYPRLERATIKVTTAYIGANADLVRGFITTPLERVISASDGIDYLESSSAQGLSTITVVLKLNHDANKALAEIGSKVDQVRGDLPPESEVPIINIEAADAQIAAMYLSFGSDLLAANQVNDYLIRVVQPRLSSLPGVQRADILGGQTFAIRAWLKPERLAAYNLSPSDIRDRLAANNYLSAVGTTKGGLVQLNLTANTDLQSVEEFKQLPVKQDGDTLVRLGDVADVVLGAESYEEDVRFSGEKAVFMGVWVMPNSNSLEVIGRVRETMETITAQLPTGMVGHVAYDSTTYIDNAIHEVRNTLIETVVIVGIVIFLFLGSVRSALVPLVAIPVSLIGAVFLMQVLGFSLNLLTLLAIVLSVGLVVDDAIVVVENIERHLHEGRSPMDAALIGARELVGPVIAMTITLVAVYAPIGFQGGLTGALFREFAFTLAGAVGISGIVALTLSPMLGSRILRKGDDERGFAGWVKTRFDRLRDRYARGLDGTLAARPFVYTIWIVLSLFCVPMYMFSPPELAPQEDQGIVFGIVVTPANATLEQATYFSQKATEVFMAPPEREQVFQITNPGFGFGGMLAKPWDQRDRSIFEIYAEVSVGLSALTGIMHPAFLPDALPSAGQLPVEFVIAGSQNHEELLALAQQIMAEAMKSGQFAFMDSDVKFDQAKAEIVIDRDKAAALGVSLQDVGADLGAAFGGAYVNRFSIDGRSYKVIPQIERSGRLNPEQLDQIYVRGPNEQLVPLSTFARVERGVEARTLNRFNQLNSVKISGVAPQSLDAGLKALEAAAATILPAGTRIDYAGQSRQLREESGKFLPAMMLALVLIFLVLAAQFNSFRDPLIIILGSVPLAMFGALIFTVLKGAGPPGWSFPLTEGWTTTMNIYSQVGLVTLVGLVAKNGILIVEFANVLQERGMSKLAAVRESALTRLRPVMMTSVATVAGHFPLVLVSGPGAEARNSIGLVLVGGMAIGTVFTLFVVPSLYMLIAKDHSHDAPPSADVDATAPAAPAVPPALPAVRAHTA
ncbi:MAG: efflux RND transporter permease subunit [Burkholderiales bacterium]|nr:efflux RND transporter permease subunit [Opitutaceae bacterium]